MTLRRAFAVLIAAVGIALCVWPAAAADRTYRIGDRVADFRLRSDRGKVVRLSSYRGKVVVATFYASWCPPCNREAPHLERDVWRAFRKRGVQVLGIAVSENESNARIPMRRFRKEHRLTYPLISDATGAVISAFGFSGIPSIVVIDGAGKYVAHPRNVEETVQVLRQMTGKR